MATTEKLAKAVAVSQHHDAITGTEKQHVANDYHRRLHQGIEEVLDTLEVTNCPLLNISQCPNTETDFEEVQLSVYNPMARPRSIVVRLPIEDIGFFEVTDYYGNLLEHQLTPLPDAILAIPGRDSPAKFDLAFVAELPAFGVGFFVIKNLGLEGDRRPHVAVQLEPEDGVFKVETGSGIEVAFSVDKSGVSIVKSREGNETLLSHEMAFYKGYPGNNIGASERASGAYIFRPLEQEAVVLEVTDYVFYSGPVYSELQATFSDSAFVVQRVYNQEMNFDIEVEWLVGPIGVDDGVGKEIVSRFRLNETLDQNGVFFTDSNGRQNIERKRDFRPSYDLLNATIEEPVSSNYYPVNSAIFIQDADHQLTVVNDRPQGGTSLKDGEIEVMIHRRLLYDDAFGVNEALNEEAFGAGLVAKGHHYIILGDDQAKSNEKRRLLANEISSQPILVFTREIQNQLEKLVSIPSQVFELPPNVNLLTLEPWFNASAPDGPVQYLVRLEHLFEEGEHPTWSQPATVSLSQMFAPTGFNIGEVSFVKETTLGGNQWKEDLTRLDWKVKGEKLSSEKPAESSSEDEVTLQPLQIRTFIIEFL